MNDYLALLSLLAALLSSTTLTLLVVGGILFGVANFVFMRWALKQLRVEPSDDGDALTGTGSTNAMADTPIRTSVGVPRNRSLRPRDPAAEQAGGASSARAYDDEAPRKEVAAASSSAKLDTDAARSGKLASFEPLIPFSPAPATAAAGAAPVTSKAAAPDPASSLIALGAAGAAPALGGTTPPAGALTLPPLAAAESKAPAEKPAPSLLPAGPASGGLILVDKDAGKTDAQPALVPKSGLEAAPAAVAGGLGGDRPFDVIAPAALSPLSAELPLPDLKEDDVKKSKSRQPTAPPEGALVAPASTPAASSEAKPASDLGLGGLVLPALVPTPESKTKEAPAAEPVAPPPAPAPSAASGPVLPPLEPVPAPVPAVEPPPAKPASRSRVFLPANLDKAPTPAPAPVEAHAPAPETPVKAHAPAPAALVEAPSPAAEIVPVHGDAPEPVLAKGAEPLLTQEPSAAPLTAVDAPLEVVQPASEPPAAAEFKAADLPPLHHPEEAKLEALQVVAREPEPAAETAPVSLRADEKAADSHAAAVPLAIEKPAFGSAPAVLPTSEAPAALPSGDAKLDPAHPQPSPLPTGPVEDTGRLILLPVEPSKAPEHAPVAEAPAVSHTTPSEVEPEPRLIDLPLEEAALANAETPPAQAAPADSVSPVDALHIHGASVEPEVPHSETPPPLPIQFALVEAAPAPRAQEKAAEEPAAAIHEAEKEPAREPVLPLADPQILLEIPEPVAVSSAPVAEVPAFTSESLTTIPSQAAAAPAEDAPTTTPRSHMTSTESTTHLPSGGRASAQLTLGFEVTSLQLTPFFKLGAVQLRSLSNIVSLHLLTTQQAESPLAAGISFQIEAVDLNESAHIRSILLKPLPQSQPLATPQPKLQVDNVQLGQGTEGAPIQVTSSQGTSTAVQLLATCTVVAMDFTPAFEIGSLRLEPTSNFVLLRSAPSQRPAALDLPPSFEVANVQLEGNAQLASVRLTPATGK